MGLQIRPLAVPEKAWERRAGCSPWFSYRICSEARAFMYGQMKYWTVPIDQSKVDLLNVDNLSLGNQSIQSRSNMLQYI